MFCCDGGGVRRDNEFSVPDGRQHYEQQQVGEPHLAQALRSNAGFQMPEGSAPPRGESSSFQTRSSYDQSAGGGWMSSLLAKGGSAFSMQKTVGVAHGLQNLYKDKLLPLERESDFHHFHQPEIPSAYFASRPLILTVGQYSTGKTSFIQHLLGDDYPTAQVGPEPTTDRFICICHGDTQQVIPGNAVVYDQTLPFEPLGRFGNGFLQKLACAKMPNRILEAVSFIDTPGVLP